MDLSTIKESVLKEQEKFKETVYNETCLAAKGLEADFKFQKMLCAAATDGTGSIYIWTHSSYIDKVAYYPFIYNFLDLHSVKMVYADFPNEYITPIYYV